MTFTNDALAGTLILAVALSACGGAPGAGAPAAPAEGEAGALPEGHPVMEASSLSQMAADADPTSGVVKETLTGGGYTYARVSVGEREIWVAGPETPLEVGQEIGIAGAMPMGNFSSPSLERTFENLYFVGGFQADGPPSDATGGVALEVLAGGGYTYVRAKIGEEELWLAGPQMEILEGDQVFWRGGMEMGLFDSPSLGRSFENIVFVGRFWVTRD